MNRRGFIQSAAITAAATMLPTEAFADPAVPEMKVKYAFSVALFFKERVRISSPTGRAFVPCIGGKVFGPRLEGAIVPYSGADYAKWGFETYYMIRARDGGQILIRNRGSMRTRDVLPTRSEAPAPPPTPGAAFDQSMPSSVGVSNNNIFRITPFFDAPLGTHNWLNHTLIVGNGTRFSNPDYTLFTYYEVL